jgi:hypothetical protein
VPVLPLQVLPEAANLDAEFRLAARFWTTSLRLETTSEAHLIQVADGRIQSVQAAGDAPGEVRIAASDEGWREFLKLRPRPFYQDLWGAMTHHGFALEGDLERFYPYYPAARRLFEILREV